MELFRATPWYGYAAVILAFALGTSLGWFLLDLDARARENATTRLALCALRADVQGRIATSEAFLRQNPQGIPGIPAATIRSSIANQHSTLRALRTLNC